MDVILGGKFPGFPRPIAENIVKDGIYIFQLPIKKLQNNQ
jgi:hypothetical protein